MYNIICMLYLNKPEKVVKKYKYLGKRVYRALKAAYPMEWDVKIEVT